MTALKIAFSLLLGLASYPAVGSMAAILIFGSALGVALFPSKNRLFVYSANLIWILFVIFGVVAGGGSVLGTFVSVGLILGVLYFNRWFSPVGVIFFGLALVALVSWQGDKGILWAYRDGLFLFSSVLWCLCFSVASLQAGGNYLSNLLMLRPIFMYYPSQAPVPASTKRDVVEPLSDDEWSRYAIIALKYVSISWACFLAREILVRLVFMVPHDGGIFDRVSFLNLDMFSQGFGLHSLSGQPNVLLRWIALVTLFLRSYLRMAHVLFMAAGIANAMGVRAAAPMNEPWKARSLSDFYGRLMPYYNYLLMQTFYIFFREKLGILRGKAKIIVSLWLTIGLGGFLIHFLRDYQGLIVAGFGEALTRYSSTLPYFCLISTFVSFSLVFQKSRKSAHEVSVGRQVLGTLLNVFVWTVVYSTFLASKHFPSSLGGYFTHMKGLLGL